MTDETSTPASEPSPPNPSPGAVPEDGTAPPPAPVKAKKKVVTRKRALIAGGAGALIIALAAGFGLGYWAGREHSGDNGRPGHHMAQRDKMNGPGDHRFGPPGRPGMPDRPGMPGDDRGPGPDRGMARPAAAGTITQINGDTWTINGLDGKPITVNINAQTTFGTAQLPQERGQFAVGDTVIVRGSTDNSTVTATSVVERQGAQPSTPPR